MLDALLAAEELPEEYRDRYQVLLLSLSLLKYLFGPCYITGPLNSLSKAIVVSSLHVFFTHFHNSGAGYSLP